MGDVCILSANTVILQANQWACLFFFISKLIVLKCNANIHDDFLSEDVITITVKLDGHIHNQALLTQGSRVALAKIQDFNMFLQ